MDIYYLCQSFWRGFCLFLTTWHMEHHILHHDPFSITCWLKSCLAFKVNAKVKPSAHVERWNHEWDTKNEAEARACYTRKRFLPKHLSRLSATTFVVISNTEMTRGWLQRNASAVMACTGQYSLSVLMKTLSYNNTLHAAYENQKKKFECSKFW